MPNLCFNEITISGDVQTFVRDLLNLNPEDGLFSSFAGQEDWGTSRDVRIVDFVHSIDKDTVILIGDTAWSPPLGFCRKIANDYKVDVQIYYEEPNGNFAGELYVNENGETGGDYEFLEGVYYCKGFKVWLNYVIEFYDDEISASYLTEKQKDIYRDVFEKHSCEQN